MLNYNDWLFESSIRTTNWSDKDHEEFESLKLRNLKDACAICDKHKVKYFLDAGTLLGLYRDKKIIKADSDNDISIFASDITPEFLEDMAPYCKSPDNASNFIQPKDFPDWDDKEKFVPIKSLKYHTIEDNGRRTSFKGREIWTDMFILYPHKD